MMRTSAALLLLVLALPAGAGGLPQLRWNADTAPAALVELARASAARVDFSRGYSQPRLSTTIAAGADAVETRTTIVSAFGDEESAYAYGNGHITLDVESTELTVNAAFVLHPDGTVQTVARDTLQSVDTETEVFGDTVTLVLPYAGLQPGSVAVLDFTRREKLAGRIYPWGRIFYLQSSFPMDELHVALSWTASRPLAWATDAERLKCVPAELSVVCDGGGYPAIARDEDANFFDLLPHFSVAERSTWADLHAITSRIVDRAQSGSARVKAAFAGLSRERGGTEGREGNQPREELIARVHGFVGKQIRYLGLEQGKHGYVPHSTDATLERRFGDCKDMSTLVIELLKNGAIAARPVLVASDFERPEKLLIPNVAYFDHMVACLDGETALCLDATDPYSTWSSLPSHLQGRVNLGLASDKVVAFPREPFLWTLEVATANAFAADGSLLERQTRKYSGSWAGFMRGQLKARTTDDRTRFLIDGYERAIGDQDGSPEFEVDNLDTFDRDLVVRSEKRYPELVREDAALDYTERLGWLMDLLDEAQSDNREYPFQFSGLSYAEDSTFDPGNHWSLSPDTVPVVRFRSRFGEVDRTSEIEGGRLVVHTAVRLPRASIEPRDLEAFARFVQAVRDNTLIQVRGALTRPR
jgi:hypothetical protein